MAPARANQQNYRGNHPQYHISSNPTRVHNGKPLVTGAATATNRIAGSTSGNAASVARNVATSRPAYIYGYGNGARSYRAYGFGNGYRNRYYGRRYGYGRSQGYNRAVVGRLQSVYYNLARINRDYNGHRVRAMHAVAMAVRQLTHRSMVYRGVGFVPGLNNGMRMGLGRGGFGAGMGRGMVMNQAQSDMRMAQSLRTLQGIRMQLASQSFGNVTHAWALGHVHRAMFELHTALSIR
jgi:hypothetical protein